MPITSIGCIGHVHIVILQEFYVACQVLGRIKETDRCSDITSHHNNITINSILIFRIESSILYFNADYIREQMMNSC
jgi:MFS superfamily sulfate permease-like transporter